MKINEKTYNFFYINYKYILYISIKKIQIVFTFNTYKIEYSLKILL